MSSYIPTLLQVAISALSVYRSVFKEGFFYLRTLALIFILDATFTDDEPL